MQNVDRILAIVGERQRSILALSVFLTFICFGASAFAKAQEAVQGTEGPAGAVAPVVPQQVRYTSKLATRAGDTVEAVFRIYAAAEGGDPLWSEMQRVTVGEDGSYSVLLGSASLSGLPQSVFAGGAARWLGVSVERSPEQERVLLSSVPYAMKSADAESLAGHAASDFVTQNQFAQLAQSAQAGNGAPAVTPFNVSGSGTAGIVPLWTGANAQGNSEITQVGSSIGINEATPAATLDVNGTAQFRGTLTLPANATATSSSGHSSNFLNLSTSAWSSTTDAPVSPGFQMFAYPVNNNTANPGAKFYMQYRLGSKVTTLFSVNSEGVIGFAPGQTFPGSSTDAANTFTGTQTIASGNLALPATTGPTSGVITIGGVPFLHGYRSGSQNVFVGGAGNLTTSGSYASAMGSQALASLSTGKYNTAVGGLALFNNNTGSQNTAFGLQALYANTTGINNTAIGFNSGNSGTAYANLSNSTAIGANSAVSQSNSLVLGQTSAINPGEYFVNVGIGTPTPRSIFEVAAGAASTLGPVITLTNPAGGAQAQAAIDFNTSTPSSAGAYNPGARILAVDDGSFSDDLFFFSNKPGGDNKGLSLNMVVASNGQVGIGTSVPANEAQLVIYQNENNIGAIQAFAETIQSGTYAGDGGNAIKARGGDSTGSSWSGAGAQFTGGNNYENGIAGDGIDAAAGIGGSQFGLAGYFDGDIYVYGTVNSGTDFRGTINPSIAGITIDHPLDPANKYLTLASVGSPELTSVISGNVITDELGVAIVSLPPWFDEIHSDFRYQLTVVGGRFAQAIVSKEIENHQFSISTNATGVKVSWQVTGVRQDAYAKAHPLIVEELKDANEQGFYKHPELFGQPEERQVEWARHPASMKRMKERRMAAQAEFAKGIQRPKSIDQRVIDPLATRAAQPASAVNRGVPWRPAPTAGPVEAPRH
jgi:hypothetical protein